MDLINQFSFSSGQWGRGSFPSYVSQTTIRQTATIKALPLACQFLCLIQLNCPIILCTVCTHCIIAACHLSLAQDTCASNFLFAEATQRTLPRRHTWWHWALTNPSMEVNPKHVILLHHTCTGFTKPYSFKDSVHSLRGHMTINTSHDMFTALGIQSEIVWLAVWHVSSCFPQIFLSVHDTS